MMNIEAKQVTAPDQLSRQAAAEWLAAQLPDKTVEQWALWLRNNSNTARTAVYRVPSSKLGRHAVYSMSDLEAFVKYERDRDIGGVKLTGRAAEVFHAFGLGKPGGGSTGRKLDVTSISEQIDESGEMFVQVVIADPLLVFRLSPRQAIDVGRELLDGGERAQSRERK